MRDLESVCTLIAELEWTSAALDRAGQLPRAVTLVLFTVADDPQRFGELAAVVPLDELSALLRGLSGSVPPAQSRAAALAMAAALREAVAPRLAGLPPEDRARLARIGDGRTRAFSALTYG